MKNLNLIKGARKATVYFIHGVKKVKIKFSCGEFEVDVSSTKSNKCLPYRYFKTLKGAIEYGIKSKLEKAWNIHEG